MIADDPEAFAAHVVKLLLNPGFAASIAEAAHRRAMASYDNNTITAQALGGLYRILDAEEGNT
jgi:hypothetical protein